MSRSYHLRRRSNNFYYHRQVPLDLVGRFGKRLISFSLGTSDPKEARRKRDLEDLKFNAQFEKMRTDTGEIPVGGKEVSPQEIVRMVQSYVEKVDGRSKQRELEDPPNGAGGRAEIRDELEYERSMLNNDEDPRGRQRLYAEGSRILGSPLSVLDHQSSNVLHEIMRRGLLELIQGNLTRVALAEPSGR